MSLKKLAAPFQKLFNRTPEPLTAEECIIVQRLRELMEVTAGGAQEDACAAPAGAQFSR